MDVDTALNEKLSRPHGPRTPVTARGIADISLYDRFARVFDRATPCPFWAVMVPPMAVLARLVAASFEPSESEALSRALDHGSSVAFHANPLHAVVGHKTAD